MARRAEHRGRIPPAAHPHGVHRARLQPLPHRRRQQLTQVHGRILVREPAGLSVHRHLPVPDRAVETAVRPAHAVRVGEHAHRRVAGLRARGEVQAGDRRPEDRQVQVVRAARVRDDPADRGRHDQLAAELRVVERTFPAEIPRAQDPPPRPVPEDEGEVTLDVRHAVVAPGAISGEDQVRRRVAGRAHATLAQRPPQVFAVIDGRVRRDHHSAVLDDQHRAAERRVELPFVARDREHGIAAPPDLQTIPAPGRHAAQHRADLRIRHRRRVTEHPDNCAHSTIPELRGPNALPRSGVGRRSRRRITFDTPGRCGRARQRRVCKGSAIRGGHSSRNMTTCYGFLARRVGGSACCRRSSSWRPEKSPFCRSEIAARQAGPSHQ